MTVMPGFTVPRGRSVTSGRLPVTPVWGIGVGRPAPTEHTSTTQLSMRLGRLSLRATSRCGLMHPAPQPSSPRVARSARQPPGERRRRSPEPGSRIPGAARGRFRHPALTPARPGVSGRPVTCRTTGCAGDPTALQWMPQPGCGPHLPAAPFAHTRTASFWASSSSGAAEPRVSTDRLIAGRRRTSPLSQQP